MVAWVDGGAGVIQDEVESQLSAMFDGELPVTECELLSRDDRDEFCVPAGRATR